MTPETDLVGVSKPNARSAIVIGDVALAASLFVLLWWVYFPGIMTADSLDMVCQAAYGRYNDWHSPLMSLIWRPLNALMQGPPLMLAIILLGFIVSAVLLVSQLSVRWWAWLFCLMLLIFYPPILNSLGVVGKDAMFLWIYLLLIAAFYRAMMDRSIFIVRVIAISLISLFAVAIRLDGAALVVGPLSFLYGVATFRQSNNPVIDQTMRALVQSSVGIGLGLGVAVVCSGLVNAFNTKILHAEQHFNIQVTLIHDIAGISVRANENLMPTYLVRQGVDLATLKIRYTPRYSDPIVWSPIGSKVPITYDPMEFGDLRTAWLRAIRHHPVFYLKHRISTFAYLLGINPPNASEVVHLKSADRSETYCPDVVKEIAAPENAVLSFYRDRILPYIWNTPLFRGWFYDGVLFLEMMWAAWRFRSNRTDRTALVVLALGSGALLHQVGLFFASSAALFRYLLPTVLTCVVTTLLIACKNEWGGSAEKVFRL